MAGIGDLLNLLIRLKKFEKQDQALCTAARTTLSRQSNQERNVFLQILVKPSVA